MSAPVFRDYAWICINSSGGKDSQTALRQVVLEADRQGYSRSQIVVNHQDLGSMEWEGTKELAALQASCYGLRFVTARYRDKDGQELELLDGVSRRGKWPSSTTRYCTSEWKRGPGGRILTELSRERPGAILNVFGFRSEESAARAKKEVLKLNTRQSTKGDLRKVWDWLPIHDWTEKQVWDDIEASGVPYHIAYSMGMPRLSCVFCIFAPKGALMIAAKHNPELFQRYLDVEVATGHDFQHKKPLRLIKEALDRGEEPPPMDGKWNM